MDKRIAELETQLAVHAERIKAVRTDMTALHEAYKAEAANFRAEMQTDFANFRAEMQAEFANFRAEMQAEFRMALAQMQKETTAFQRSLITHTRWTAGLAVGAVVALGIIMRWPAAG